MRNPENPEARTSMRSTSVLVALVIGSLFLLEAAVAAVLVPPPKRPPRVDAPESLAATATAVATSAVAVQAPGPQYTVLVPSQAEPTAQPDWSTFVSGRPETITVNGRTAYRVPGLSSPILLCATDQWERCRWQVPGTQLVVDRYMLFNGTGYVDPEYPVKIAWVARVGATWSVMQGQDYQCSGNGLTVTP